MERLVGAVQGSLEAGARAVEEGARAGARAIDTALDTVQDSVQESRGGQGFPRPLGLSRLVANPFLLTLQSPAYRHLLLASSLVAAKASLLAATVQLLRLARGAHNLPEDAAALGGSVAEDALVRRVEAALEQDTQQLPMFLALGLAYTSTDPDPAEAVALFRLFVACRVAEGWGRVAGAHPARMWANLGGLAVLGVLGARTLHHLWTVFNFE